MAGAQTVSSAMKIVAREVEKDGIHGARDLQEMEEPRLVTHFRRASDGELTISIRRHTEDVISFIRFACVDAIALMP